MQILGHYNILNVNEIAFLTRSINDDKRFRIIIFLQYFFTKEKLSKIYFMMTAESEEVNNLLYTLIYKEAEEYFSNYEKDDIFNIEFFNDLQKFSNLCLGHNNITLFEFYSILLENSRFIISSGEETLTQLFKSIALLTNVNVWYDIGKRSVDFYKENANEMFQKLEIYDFDNFERYVESLNNFF
ncbi:hypothetical protein NCER_102409 [Vairimorpha ceranae BRL01]|uniref:Uncharacterized protein n=1 Tax=Vairimorpha ceranae (strain BRL01) TaxID=578460 RepID=C4VBZ2_VAIC1|nr:hypothetical protein NCER_102409 [Vairimorpha ceranae BRL01]